MSAKEVGFLQHLTLKDWGDGPYTHWHMLALNKRDLPYDRMTWLEVSIKTAPEKERFGKVEKWSELDELLEPFFGWK